jgi:hypothetical protein
VHKYEGVARLYPGFKQRASAQLDCSLIQANAGGRTFLKRSTRADYAEKVVDYVRVGVACRQRRVKNCRSNTSFSGCLCQNAVIIAREGDEQVDVSETFPHPFCVFGEPRACPARFQRQQRICIPRHHSQLPCRWSHEKYLGPTGSFSQSREDRQGHDDIAKRARAIHDDAPEAFQGVLGEH